MSLKDYHTLVGSFWKGKASKSHLKEKSAFEPYCTSYRPYMMSYHQHTRPCTKYERHLEPLPKYKCISPNCDQCEYEQLKRKSNSSLENIILKLKKSRHTDKDLPPRHYPHDVVEPLTERPVKSLYEPHKPISPVKSLYEPHKPISLRTLVPHNERVIVHDDPPRIREPPREPPRMDYREYENRESVKLDVEKEAEKLSERYREEHERSRSVMERHFDSKESEEKSSFVSLLEQKDDLQYPSTLSMATSYPPLPPPLPPKNELKLKIDDPKTKYDKDEDVDVSNVSPPLPSPPKTSDPGTTTPTTSTTTPYNPDDKDAVDKIAETKCDKCQKRFYRRSQLIRHISNHVVHECHKCNAFFYCVRKFKKHMSTHESYPCEFCEEEFYEASAWYHHRAKHTMVECSSCDMIFYNKTALLKHKFTHLQYICPVCRFPFSNLNHWISHRSCHKTFGSTLLTPLFSCRECSTTFPSQDTYMKHACLHRMKKPLDTKRPLISKRDISDLIGVDQTAR